MNMKTILAATLATVLLSGCATQTFTVNGDATGAEDLSNRSYFFVGGIGQGDLIEAGEVCDGIENVAAVQTLDDPLDILLRIVTNGLFSPRAYKVYCVN